MNKSIKKFYYNNHLFWICLLLIVSTGLCFVKFLQLNEGGAMTFMSMGILWLIPYFFGFSEGLIAGLIFGFLKFAVTYITGEHINYNIIALILEYPVAFAGMSLGALLPQNRKTHAYIKECKRIRKESNSLIEDDNEREYYEGSISIEMNMLRQGDEELENSHSGLILGYGVGVLFILIVYIISALCFYPPQENMNVLENLIFNIFYDSSYLLAEGFFTVLLFMIPGVYNSITYIKHIANNPMDIPSIYGF